MYYYRRTLILKMLNRGLLNARGFEAYVFLKEVLKYCENKPEIIVDRGFCTGLTKLF